MFITKTTMIIKIIMEIIIIAKKNNKCINII